MRHFLIRKLPLLMVIGIAACAADLERSDVRFSSYPEDPERRLLRIPKAVALTPSTGYSETLKAGSTNEPVHILGLLGSLLSRPIGCI
jgi:hypothetical protein